MPENYKLVCSFSRFGVAGVYYGISLNIRGFGVNIYLTQFIYSLSEIPAKLFIVFTLEKVGRRFNQAGSLFLTGLCVVCTMIIPQGKWFGCEAENSKQMGRNT